MIYEGFEKQCLEFAVVVVEFFFVYVLAIFGQIKTKSARSEILKVGKLEQLRTA